MLPIVLGFAASSARSEDAALLTVAEQSGFRATARYAEVVALLDRLAEKSPLAQRTTLGRSGEGRELPVLILSDPPVATAEEARALATRREKLIVMAIGNIHGGEVCGKEALPMLAREIVTTPDHPLLRDLILLLAPIYNADGNERVALDNRSYQDGPELGMGERVNAAGLDLNRDFIKLEAPETRALVGFLNRWDPALFIDTHTTNGSFHRYLITYDGPKTPGGSPLLIDFARRELFPALTRRCHERGVETYYYGNFEGDHARWTSFPASARFGTSYIGLRGRLGILSEAYSYAPFERRVRGTLEFVRACFEYAAANKTRIARLLADADAQTTAAGMNPRADDRVGLRFDARAETEKVVVAGYVEQPKEEDEPELARGGSSAGDARPRGPTTRPRREWQRTISTATARDYQVELWRDFHATRSAPRPYAYLVPAELTGVLENLRLHGVRVEPLANERDAEVEVYRIDAAAFAEREFQKHRLATLEVTPRVERRRLPADTVVVPTGQPLGNLVAYLLEPACEDGLAAWNFLDAHLEVGAEYPILRAPRAFGDE
jgi:hypothetical protein